MESHPVVTQCLTLGLPEAFCLHPACAQVLHAPPILLDDYERRTLRLERLADHSAHPRADISGG